MPPATRGRDSSVKRPFGRLGIGQFLLSKFVPDEGALERIARSRCVMMANQAYPWYPTQRDPPQYLHDKVEIFTSK